MSIVPLCDGSAVVVDEGTLAAAVLNPVAAFIARRLAEGETDIATLVAAVAAEFDAPLDVIEGDVRRFVAEMGTRFGVDRGLETESP